MKFCSSVNLNRIRSFRQISMMTVMLDRGVVITVGIKEYTISFVICNLCC